MHKILPRRSNLCTNLEREITMRLFNANRIMTSLASKEVKTVIVDGVHKTVFEKCSVWAWNERPAPSRLYLNFLSFFPSSSFSCLLWSFFVCLFSWCSQRRPSRKGGLFDTLSSTNPIYALLDHTKRTIFLRQTGDNNHSFRLPTQQIVFYNEHVCNGQLTTRAADRKALARRQEPNESQYALHGNVH